MPRSRWTHRGALILLDLAARVTVVAGCLTLVGGRPSDAVAVSAFATIAATLRALVSSRIYEAVWVETWGKVIRALERGGPKDMQALPLVQGILDQTQYESSTLPGLWAQGVSLALVLVAVAVLLGPKWLLLAAAGAIPFVLFTRHNRRRIREARQAAWSMFPALSRNIRVLLEAAVELRASGHEGRLTSDTRAIIARMGDAERRARTWSSIASLLPASIALLALAAPVRAGVAFLREALFGGRSLAVGILGLAGATFALGIARMIEATAESAPARRTLRDYLASTDAVPSKHEGTHVVASLRTAPFLWEQVSCFHGRTAHATPSRVSCLWDSPGLAISGENGAGKSTLGLALLGLVPMSGLMRIGGVVAADIDWADFRRRSTHVAQNPFVNPDMSVAWHLAGFGLREVEPVRMEAVLAEVGLLDLLRERAKGGGDAPWAIRIGQLSGGEQQRVHLARALLSESELVILDEPEASMDREGRDRLKVLLETLSRTRRVIVIAHDESVVPEGFARLVCVAESAAESPLPRAKTSALPPSKKKVDEEGSVL